MRRRQGAQHHCFPVLRGLWHQSVGKAGTPCQATTPRLACASCWSAICGIGGIRPLRPPASLLHKAAFCKVVASRYAEAALSVGHRWRALTGLQNGPYAKWPTLAAVAQPSAHPGQFLPYAPPSGRPCGCRSAVALVSCFASLPVSGLWPVMTS